MSLLRNIGVRLAALVVAGALMAGPAMAQECLGKREIQDAVSSGEIMSLDTVLAMAGIDSSAEILSVQVCDTEGQLDYIIGVLSPDGTAQTLTLTAQ